MSKFTAVTSGVEVPRRCPEAAALRLLAKCLDDFAHHNIEVACALLDACGRFLLKQPCSRAGPAACGGPVQMKGCL